MDVDLEGKTSYCGAKISEKGELVILFHENHLGTGILYAFEEKNLTVAINSAPTGAGDQRLSFKARQGIAKDYTVSIDKIEQVVNKILGVEFTFESNFETTFAQLKAANLLAKEEDSIGRLTWQYFDSLASTLKYDKVDQGEMIRDALLEEMASKKVVFWLLDFGTLKKAFAETVFEDGILYIQTDIEHSGVDPRRSTDKLLDSL
ncbi:hypothetical protein VHEMI03172 [[Torrubiella] hemipterigena]|uniref:Uncharacterized protein n=1 Tax=[Torrubiella] hemipterigena TaxID=1531966 RepID=A0A0A1TAH2_9HYPO|nr:hypothetical protein VHEMI03172 [[Torrubiella] hemipterigena]